MSRFSPIFVALLFSVSAAPTTALAQANVAITPGTAVSDPQGGPVGVVSAVNGDVVTVKTDQSEAHLGKGSFTTFDGKLLIGMTKAELDAAVAEQKAKTEASLTVGATVKGTGGAPIGTIESIDETSVTLKLTSGRSVKIDRSGIAGAPDGAVVGVSAEELEAQLEKTN